MPGHSPSRRCRKCVGETRGHKSQAAKGSMRSAISTRSCAPNSPRSSTMPSSKGQAMMAVTAIDKIRLNLDSVSRIAGLDRRGDPPTPLHVNVDLGSLVDRLVEFDQGRSERRRHQEARKDDRCRITTCFARWHGRHSIASLRTSGSNGNSVFCRTHGRWNCCGRRQEVR